MRVRSVNSGPPRPSRVTDVMRIGGKLGHHLLLGPVTQQNLIADLWSIVAGPGPQDSQPFSRIARRVNDPEILGRCQGLLGPRLWSREGKQE